MEQISNWVIWNISCHKVMITWRNKQPFWCCLTVWIGPKKIPDLEILTLEKNSSWTVLNCLPYIPPLPAGRYLLFAFAFDLQLVVRAEVTTNAAAKRDWPICQARPRSQFISQSSGKMLEIWYFWFSVMTICSSREGLANLSGSASIRFYFACFFTILQKQTFHSYFEFSYGFLVEIRLWMVNR